MGGKRKFAAERANGQFGIVAYWQVLARRSYEEDIILLHLQASDWAIRAQVFQLELESHSDTH